jgi:hypothetical protein
VRELGETGVCGMTITLYLDEFKRTRIINNLKFLIAQSSTRILGQFEDLEAGFDSIVEAEQDRLSNLGFGGEYGEDIPELAYENACEQFWMLNELKRNMLLSTLSAAYFQWDKELRKFIHEQFAGFVSDAETFKELWRLPHSKLLEELTKLGWSMQQTDFVGQINDCYHIVNSYKHGEGISLEKLKVSRPQYFRNYDLQSEMNSTSLTNTKFSYEHLGVTLEQFTERTSAFQKFWESFPERL